MVLRICPGPATLLLIYIQSAVALPEKWLTKGVDELLLLLPVLANDFGSLREQG